MESASKPQHVQAKTEERVSVMAAMLRLGTGFSIALFLLVYLFLCAAIVWLPHMSAEELAQFMGDRSSAIDFDKLPELESGITVATKLHLWSLLTIAFLLLLFCLSRLHTLFGNFRDRKVFIQHNVTLLRTLGVALMIGAFIHPLIDITQPDLLQWFIATQGTSAYSYNTFDLIFNALTGLFWASLVFLSAWILDIGREIYNESEYTI